MLAYFIRKKKRVQPSISSTYDKIKREHAAAKIIQSYFRKRLMVCSICFENFIKNKYRVILKCKHTFHFVCYNKLYKYNYKFCPNCRKKFTSVENSTNSLGDMLDNNVGEISQRIYNNRRRQNRRNTLITL